MNRVLCDSCFWFGLLDPSDSYACSSEDWYDTLTSFGDLKFIIPYPSLYETLKTSICKNHRAMERFNDIVTRYGYLIPDDDYREDAFKQVMSKSNYLGRHFSFVDIIIRLILEDPNVHKSLFITSNVGDFKDVTDSNGIELLEIQTNTDFIANRK